MSDANGWVEHHGMKDPNIPGGTFVQVRFRDGDEGHCGAMHDWDEEWQWTPDDMHRRDIIAWRMLAAIGGTREQPMLIMQPYDDQDDIPALTPGVSIWKR